MDTSTQTIATFTGTLLRREHNPGQKFVQLVFREDDQNWLCISTKLINTKLTIGQEYHIEGVFKQAGDKAYIYEPAIKPVRRSKSRNILSPKILHRRSVVIGGSIAVAILVVGGTVFALQGNPETVKTTNASTHTAVQSSSDTSDDAVVPQTTTETAPPTETTPPPAAVPTPLRRTTNVTPAPTPTPVVTPPVTPPPAETPTPTPSTPTPDPVPEPVTPPVEPAPPADPPNEPPADPPVGS